MSASASWILLLLFGGWLITLGLADVMVRRAIRRAKGTNVSEPPSGIFSFYAKITWLETRTNELPPDLRSDVKRIIAARKVLALLGLAVAATYVVALTIGSR
jgi:hypothetical protein